MGFLTHNTTLTAFLIKYLNFALPVLFVLTIAGVFYRLKYLKKIDSITKKADKEDIKEIKEELKNLRESIEDSKKK